MGPRSSRNLRGPLASAFGSSRCRCRYFRPGRRPVELLGSERLGRKGPGGSGANSSGMAAAASAQTLPMRERVGPQTPSSSIRQSTPPPQLGPRVQSPRTPPASRPPWAKGYPGSASRSRTYRVSPLSSPMLTPWGLGDTPPPPWQELGTGSKALASAALLQTPERSVLRHPATPSLVDSTPDQPRQRQVSWKRTPRTCTPQTQTPQGLAQHDQTPEITARSMTTPPSGPQESHVRMRAELDMQLRAGFVPGVCMVLERSHCCAQKHHLYEATKRGHAEAVRFLLRHRSVGGVDEPVDQVCGGRRPLHLAVEACITEGDTGYQIAEALLQHGANPNRSVVDDLMADSPLLLAAKQGNAAATGLLLAHGADPNEATAGGDLPLIAACSQVIAFPGPWGQISGNDSVVEALLCGGADPFRVDAAGLTARMYASGRSSWLRKKLVRAERWCIRRQVTLLCKWNQDSAQGSDLVNLVSFFKIPELSKLIVTFVS